MTTYQPVIKKWDGETIPLICDYHLWYAIGQVKNYLKSANYNDNWLVTILCDGEDSDILTIANDDDVLTIDTKTPKIRQVIFQ